MESTNTHSVWTFCEGYMNGSSQLQSFFSTLICLLLLSTKNQPNVLEMTAAECVLV